MKQRHPTEGSVLEIVDLGPAIARWQAMTAAEQRAWILNDLEIHWGGQIAA